MYPYLELGSFRISTYGLMAVLAALVGCVFAARRFKRFGFPKDTWASIGTYIIIGVLVGSKLLYFITVWDDFIGDIGKVPFAEFSRRYITGGLVFYGGILAAMLSVLLYTKIHKLSFARMSVAMTPAMPLIHGIARIGCFLSGCCGGSVYGLPVQLVESACLFALFFVLMAACKPTAKRPIGLGLYLVIYPVVRFILEFFRTDELRGFVGALSTSQFISCLLLPIGILMVIFADPLFAAIDRFMLKGAAAGSETAAEETIPEPAEENASDEPEDR